MAYQFFWSYSLFYSNCDTFLFLSPNSFTTLFLWLYPPQFSISLNVVFLLSLFSQFLSLLFWYHTHLHISIISPPSVSHSYSSFYHQHPDPGFQIHLVNQWIFQAVHNLKSQLSSKLYNFLALFLRLCFLHL